MGRLCSLDHFLICGIKSSVAQVLHDRPMEKPCVLKHHTEHLSQVVPVKVSDIVPINLDRTAVYIVETHEQLDHCRLSGPRRTYDSDLLSFFYFCREVIDDDLIRIVTEVYMVEFHSSF